MRVPTLLAYGLAAGLFLAGVAAAQSAQELGPESYRATSWTIASGLPQGSINDLVQTSDGALWAATFGGLVRFDGLEFQVFDLDSLPAMPSNRATALVGDGADGLWVALQSGHVLHFRAGEALAVEPIPGPDAVPLALLRHPDGALWVECNGGCVQRFAAGKWSLLVQPGAGGSYEGLCLNRDGSVCAAVGSEVVVFEPDGTQRERARAPERILSIASGDAQGPWIGLASGLARMRSHAVERSPLTLDPPRPIQCILAGEDEELWLGTPDGPVHVSPLGVPARGMLLDSNEPVPAVNVRALIRDHEGNLWLGADGFGLIRLRPHQLVSFGLPEWRSGVSALAEDGEGGAWIALGCNGLWRIQDGTWMPKEVRLPPATLPEACIESLLRDASGRVWIGRAGALLRLDLHVSSEFLPVLGDLKLTGVIGPMLELGAGDVWVSTSSGQLVHLAPDDRVLERYEVHGEIHALALAADGSLWIGGDGALWHLVHGTLVPPGGAGDLPRGVLRDILAQADGGIWVASYGGGLGYLKDGVGVTLSRAQGLPDNSLSAIRDDGEGRLWILSNQGLVVANREDLLAVATGKAASFVPVVLGPEAGMHESEYGSPAAMRDTHGRLWFGTIAGPVRVGPHDFPFNRTPPAVRVERLRADEVALPCGKSVVVPALTRRLVLEFTAFALTAPERTRFHYRLESFDENWIEAGGQRWAAFTALAPGHYTFEVAARNEDGVWSVAPARLELEVLAAWWQTWSFRIAAVCAAAALLFLAHRRRVEVIGRRAQALLEATEGRAQAEERESRLREELAHAGRVATAGELASSLAHEVNQPLAAIVTNAQAGQRYLAREPISRSDLDEVLSDIAQQGQRASEVIRRLRTFLRKHEAQRAPLDLNGVVRDTLPLVRREIQDQGVRTELVLEEHLPEVLADPVQLQQVLVNLVKNACEALAGRPEPRLIEIRSRRYDGRVLLDFSDNGPGLAPEVVGKLFQPYVTTKPGGMGLGLAICRSIVEAHGGRLGTESRAGGGQVFHIDLPAAGSDA